MEYEFIDSIKLNFNPASMNILNMAIGVMMFGMALDIKKKDFLQIIKSPKGPVIGLIAQFILLPAFTFLLTLVFPAAPSILLGMILVASCPGGNLSNIITFLAKGNSALSVSMTAVSTAVAVVMTPLNLSFWGSLNPATAPILQAVSLNPFSVFKTVVIILGIPLVLGILFASRFTKTAEKIKSPFKIFSIVVFIGVVGMALIANGEQFLKVIGLIAFAVLIHNALAFFIGYSAAKLGGLNIRDRRAVSIEVGIQNSALALTLVFGFFHGLGGMAIIAGWWGVWHIISGLFMAFIWSRKEIKE